MAAQGGVLVPLVQHCCLSSSARGRLNETTMVTVTAATASHNTTNQCYTNENISAGLIIVAFVVIEMISIRLKCFTFLSLRITN